MAQSPDPSHKLKLSIDLHSVKDLQFATNMVCQYSLKLSVTQTRVFKAQQATPVSQGAHETQL